MRYKVVNLDFAHAMIGGLPNPEYDRGVVYDTQATERNSLTGKDQRKAVYFGTVAECAAWVRSQAD